MTERHVLDDRRKFWDAHAERDPLWAVLSDPGHQERKWMSDAFQTGVNEVALILYQLIRMASVTVVVRWISAGVTRDTGACPAFRAGRGVDVSSRMVQTATS